MRAIKISTTIVSVSFVVAVLAACASSTTADPCNGGGQYSGADTCDKIVQGFNAKCSGTGLTIDCAKLVAPECTTTKKFCKAGVDKVLVDFQAAADCTAAQAVTAKYTCFD